MGFILRPETSGSGPGNPTDQHQMATRRHARRSARSDSRRSHAASAVPPRAAIVWMSLVGAMTTVGGGLLLLDGGRRSPLDGVRLPAATALMAVSTPRSLEGVLDTREPSIATDGSRSWSTIRVAFGTPQSSSVAPGHPWPGPPLRHRQRQRHGRAEVRRLSLARPFPGHAAGDHEVADWHNRHPISICLVGDGNRRGFTPGPAPSGGPGRHAAGSHPNRQHRPPQRCFRGSDPGVAFRHAFREMVAGLD